MREFFRGWRRKSGVLTLLMALVFMAGWVRGFTTADQIEFYPGATTFHTWFSENGNLGWESGDDFERTTPREKQWRLIWTHYQIEPEFDFESGNIRTFTLDVGLPWDIFPATAIACNSAPRMLRPMQFHHPPTDVTITLANSLHPPKIHSKEDS